jgi:hypothetical protein
MIVKIRDIAITVAVIVVAIVYAISALQQTSYNHKQFNASLFCGRQYSNITDDSGYLVCMRNRGFEVTSSNNNSSY